MKSNARSILLLPALITLFLLPITPCDAASDQATKTLTSRITAVTVYSDRARITRAASLSLPAGEHRLMFDNLPTALEPSSIQVNGTGSATLSDVKTGIERYAQTTDKELKALIDEKTVIEDRVAETDTRVTQARNEKVFLENITKKLTGVTEKTPAGELDPEKWVKMVDFYRNRNMLLDKEIHNAEVAKRDLKSRLEKVNRQIEDAGSGEQKTRYHVEVLVRMKESGPLSLILSYIVDGPSWQPLYDLRVSAREKKMNLVYNALIRQNTTESWDDVALELSTAQPRIGGQQPELSPWYVNFYEPRVNARRYTAMPSPAPPARQMMESADSGYLKTEKKVGGPMEPEIEKETAGVQTNATSVVFEIKGRNSIASDNLPHKVTVLIRDFPAEFRYSTAPKLSPHAYLKTKVVNSTDFPLLQGTTNVFLDNNFVANASLNQVAPGEEFWTFLGVDGGIKVERKFLRKHQERDGIFDKKTKMVYEYVTEIINNKKNEEELVVWDQVPISSHQDILVKLVDPKFEKDTPTLKKNELNYLEWYLKMKPGEKVKIPLVYTVEYPEGKEVTGLN